MQLALHWSRQSREKILNQLQPHWPKIKRLLTIAFFGAVAFLLYNRAATIEWQKVISTLRETEASSLAIGFGLGFLCYSAYASYDLFGRHILQLKINAFSTWAAAWISYACNLNLGAVVGSVAFRYRLYSRLGVSNGDVTRILGITVISNWMGYFLLAGGLFISGTLVPPKSWFVNQLALQLIGVGFLLLVGVYLYFCISSKKREYKIRNSHFTLPSGRIVLLQFVVALTHWTLMATVIYQFMPDSLNFSTVYAVMLISCVAGALSHVPGGLGVLEAVFVALLAGDIPEHELIAGAFAYRCVFYFAPLLVSLPVYIAFESRYRKNRQ